MDQEAVQSEVLETYQSSAKQFFGIIPTIIILLLTIGLVALGWYAVNLRSQLAVQATQKIPPSIPTPWPTATPEPEVSVVFQPPELIFQGPTASATVPLGYDNSNIFDYGISTDKKFASSHVFDSEADDYKLVIYNTQTNTFVDLENDILPARLNENGSKLTVGRVSHYWTGAWAWGDEAYITVDYLLSFDHDIYYLTVDDDANAATLTKVAGLPEQSVPRGWIPGTVDFIVESVLKTENRPNSGASTITESEYLILHQGKLK